MKRKKNWLLEYRNSKH